MTAGQGIDVASHAVDLLDAVVRHFASAPPGNELPARRLVVPGESRAFAWDCEQLTVALVGIGWGPADDSGPIAPRSGNPASVSGVRHAVFAVQLVRCTPSQTERVKGTEYPSRDALHAAGLQSMRDTGLLSQAITEYVTGYAPRSPLGVSCKAGVAEPIGPTGGFHAVESTLVISVGELV